jgi:HK97 family phage major capsid protein
VTEKPEFKHHFADRKFKGGVTFTLEDVSPSEILSKFHDFDTMGNIGLKTLFATGAGWAPQSIRLPGAVDAVTRPIQVLDVIPIGRTDQAAIVFMEETTRTHASAEKAEGVAYAESTFVLTERTSNVRKITDSIPVTDEQLEDVAQAESYLNSRIVFGLRQRLDGQILGGDGIAPNLQGLNTLTGTNTQALGTDPIPDAIYKAGRQVRVTGRAIPTHVLLHPVDWEKIRLLRTADGLYIWGNPSESGPERIWGWPVVQQDILTAGTAFVGSFQPQWVSLFERRGVDVQIGYSGTQFLEGKRTVRADMRFALVFFRPAAFSKVTGL